MILIVLPLLLIFYLSLAPMPGRIAKKKKHPQAKVIRLCGWTAIISGSISAWVLALMWAHNDSPEASLNFEASIAHLNKKARRRNLYRY